MHMFLLLKFEPLRCLSMYVVTQYCHLFSKYFQCGLDQVISFFLPSLQCLFHCLCITFMDWRICYITILMNYLFSLWVALLFLYEVFYRLLKPASMQKFLRQFEYLRMRAQYSTFAIWLKILITLQFSPFPLPLNI